jgi:hypothetical protein
MGERTIFVDEFQDSASKDGDWLIIDKFTESVERSNRNLRIQHIYCSLGISLIVPQFCQNTFFLQLTLFLLSRSMHKLLTYFSFLKPWEMTTFYQENIWNRRRLHKLSKLPYTTINFTVISALQSSVKSIGKCKKKSLHNQPKQFFFWEFRGLTEKWKSLNGTISVRTVTLCKFVILIANIIKIKS